MRYTEADLKTIQDRIKSTHVVMTHICADKEPAKQISLPGSKQVAKAIRNGARKRPDHPSAAKEVWRERNWPGKLKYQLQAAKQPLPTLEYVFHPSRKWRFDLAWPKLKVAVEIEGGVWTQGRHTRGSGFISDMSKYNEAARLGWSLYRFTPSQVKKGTALHYLRAAFSDLR